MIDINHLEDNLIAVTVSGTLTDEDYETLTPRLEREHENVISDAANAGAGTIIRGGVGRGEPGVGLGTTDRWDTWEKASLDDLLGSGESRTAFLLRFTLSHPDMSTTIVGTKSPEHLAENLRIAEQGALPTDVYEEAKRRLAEVGEKPNS